MNIPFFNLLRKTKEKFEGRRRPQGPQPMPSVTNKPETDKLAKRVMPYAVRTLTPEPSAPALAAAVVSGTRRISVGRPSSEVLARDLPPVVALALEPRVERVLSLSLDDVIAEMPPGYIKSRDNFDPTRRVLLKAAEVEKGLAAGRPTMTVAALYQQMPEIFVQTVPASDNALVALPFAKLIDELSNLHTRDDQTVEPVVPQVETPFLQVTVEEAAKFGTTMAPFTTAELPTVRLEPATAMTISTAEPEPTERVVPPPINRDTASSTLTAGEADRNGAEAATGIPFIGPTESAGGAPKKLLPIGTGEPAFPRVPASSGPPVPPVSPPAAPMRIPFKLTEDLKAPAGTEEAPAEKAKSAPATQAEFTAMRGAKLTLPLRPILESLPPGQRGGDAASVSADAKISFPMTLIESQLASGKVVVKPKDFHAALPAEHRNLFLPDVAEEDVVQLSLSDVLANLPKEALRVREDQEVEMLDEVFQTPFLSKAEEDARRFAEEKGEELESETLKTETHRVSTVEAEVPEVEAAVVETEKVEPAAPVEEATSAPATQAEFNARREPKLTLPLRRILESLPPPQRGGDAGSVPATTKISFPMSLIEPQLASGKVAVKPQDFHAALPAEHRNLFLADATEDAVQLSLSDVLANLPGEALRIREDQEIETQDELFQTPFLTKALEDAQRFGEGATETTKVETPAEPTLETAEPTLALKDETLTLDQPTPETEENLEVTRSASAEAPSSTQGTEQLEGALPATEEVLASAPVEAAPKFDAKEAVAQVCALPGVAWCSVIFADGLNIAGNVPAEMHIDGLSAVAPTMLRKLEKHMVETQLGSLNCMTVHGEKSPVTFFAAGNICLTAVHNGAELSPESRRELSRITQELSRTYSQPETAHVDH